MKICILQTDILWEDGGGNIRAAEKLLDGNPGADLYVLPEMWGTGFQTHPEADRLRPVAEMCLEWMKAEAVGRNCALAGSLPVAKAAGDAGDKLCWHNAFSLSVPTDRWKLTANGICLPMAAKTVITQQDTNVWWWNIVVCVSCLRSVTICVFPYSRVIVATTMWLSTLPTGPKVA